MICSRIALVCRILIFVLNFIEAIRTLTLQSNHLSETLDVNLYLTSTHSVSEMVKALVHPILLLFYKSLLLSHWTHYATILGSTLNCQVSSSNKCLAIFRNLNSQNFYKFSSSLAPKEVRSKWNSTRGTSWIQYRLSTLSTCTVILWVNRILGFRWATRIPYRLSSL